MSIPFLSEIAQECVFVVAVNLNRGNHHWSLVKIFCHDLRIDF